VVGRRVSHKMIAREEGSEEGPKSGACGGGYPNSRLGGGPEGDVGGGVEEVGLVCEIFDVRDSDDCCC
jgi:hypothetical protein